jgi:hypothetical protein
MEGKAMESEERRLTIIRMAILTFVPDDLPVFFVHTLIPSKSYFEEGCSRFI